MANWKKLIYSGSAANLYAVTVSNISSTTNAYAPVVWNSNTGMFHTTASTALGSSDASIVNISTAGALKHRLTMVTGSGTGPHTIFADSGLTYDANNDRLGIGTTSPNQKLEVKAGNINIQNGDGGFLSFNNGDANIKIHYNDVTVDEGVINGRDLSFETFKTGIGTTEKMRITKDGNVGIGTIAPPKKLTVQGDISASGDLQIDGDTIINGDLALFGIQLFEDQIQVRSGSTIVGSGSNPATTTHQFTGSILVNGSIIADSITGTVATATNATTIALATEVAGAYTLPLIFSTDGNNNATLINGSGITYTTTTDTLACNIGGTAAFATNFDINNMDVATNLGIISAFNNEYDVFFANVVNDDETDLKYTAQPAGHSYFQYNPNTQTLSVTNITSNLTGTATNADALDNQNGLYYLDYDNFTNTPTNVSEFTNDSGYLTSVDQVGNADTVDNLHAASFLLSDAADTATGDLTFTGFCTFDNDASPAVKIISDDFAEGLQIHRNHSTNAPAIKFTNNAGTKGILYADTSGVLRWRDGSSSNTWQIWHEGNDGPASGLSAQFAATATNVAYTGLTGTVPTWNQNTTGNADTATTATIASNVKVTADTGTDEHPITFIDETSPDGGSEHLKANPNLKYNPGTDTLTVGNITGTISTATNANNVNIQTISSGTQRLLVADHPVDAPGSGDGFKSVFGEDALQWDATNHRLGINGNPSHALDVTGKGRFTSDFQVEGDTLAIGKTMHHIGDTNTRLDFEFWDDANNTYKGFRLFANGTEMLRGANYDGSTYDGADAALIVNTDNIDMNFVVNGDTAANLFFVDGGNDRIGINTNTPGCRLELKGNSTSFAASFKVLDAGNEIQLTRNSFNYITAGAYYGYGASNNTAGKLVLRTVDSAGIAHQAMSIDNDGTIDIAKNNPTTTLLTVTANGNTEPDVPTVIFKHSEASVDDNDTILELDFDDDTSIGSSNNYIRFQNQSGIVGSINSEVAYSTFTGAHLSQKPSGSSFINWKPGMIVKSTGEIINRGNYETGSLSMAWPIVDITSTQKDKAVMGVFTSLTPAPTDHKLYTTDSKNVGRISGLNDNAPSINYNALGEGRILVTDTNGDIEVGDYICTSAKLGHGEKQDDDLMHNYTVAKATQPCSFTSASIDSDLGFKSMLIACTYHCG